MTWTPETLNSNCPYVTQDEIDFMRNFGWKIPIGGIIVMIGAGPGLLVFSLLDSKASPNWDITIIDLNSIQWAKAHYTDSDKWISLYVPKIHWIEGRDSYDVGVGWSGREIDFLIVDGDHTERGINRDMIAWLPHVREGGHVFYHDYLFAGTRWEPFSREEYPEVQPQVDFVMTPDCSESVWRGGCSRVFKITRKIKKVIIKE